MARNWIGFIGSVDDLRIVHAEVPMDGPMVIKSAETWRLEGRQRPAAYANIRRRFSEYVRANGVELIAYKAAASRRFGAGPDPFLAAELRGVVLAAVGDTEATARGFNKASVSRTFGSMSVDEHVKDDAFWNCACVGDVPRTHREAALYLLAAR